jgi:polysaccharide pyruvyl transferase WcaK-like protein
MYETDRIFLVASSTIRNKGDAAIYVGALQLITQSLPHCKVSLSIEDYTEPNIDFINRMFDFKNVDITEGLVQGTKKVLTKTLNVNKLLIKKSPSNDEKEILSVSKKDTSPSDLHVHAHFFKYFCTPLLLTKLFQKLNTNQEPFNSLRNSDIAVSLGHNLTRSCLSNSLLSYYVPKVVFGKKAVIFPISISKYSYSNVRLTNWLLESYTRYILEKMDCIMIREQSSFETLRNRLHIRNKNAFSVADTAFLLPKGNTQDVLRMVNNQGVTIEKPALAVCIRGRNYFRTYGNFVDDDYFSFIGNFAKVVDTLIEKLGVNVYFIPMTMLRPDGLDDYDYQGASRIYEKLKQKSQDRAFIINTWDMTPGELAALLEQMDFVLTMRLHQLITASTVAVPSVLVLPEQELKAVGITKSLGLYDYLVNLGEPSHTLYKTIVDKVLEGFANRDELSQTIKTRLPVIQKDVRVAGKILSSIMSEP